MKVITILFFSFSLAVLCCEAQHAKNSDAGQTVSVATFQEKINEFPDEQIVDVRTPAEWDGGIIPGAMTINFMDDSFSEKVKSLDKTKPVMVYCAAGGRSAKAMYKLTEMGFTKVYNLDGGISAWQAAGKKTVKK